MNTPVAEGIGPGGRIQGSLEMARVWLLSDFLRKWVFFGLLIGVVAGLGAILFYVAIDLSTQLFLGQLAGYDPPGPRGEGTTEYVEMARPWALPLVVGLGGLISGLIVFSLAPEAEGHGTDAAIDAFHQRAGRIRSRIPFIKLVSSAVTIGSGGSAGREGPTAQIAAGFGSWIGGVFYLSPADRRIALAVGVGAGIGAIFKAPLGGALLSAEILYLRDFELEALVPGFIASVVGYTIFASWSGWEPVFGDALGFKFSDPESLIWYAALGVVCGLVGILYVRFFYGTRDFFHRIHVPPHIKPAIAGVVVGTMGIFFPQILSMGYGWLQFAVEGNTAELAAWTMLALVFLKIIATSLTIGSGGSGGVFAPGLFIGGMVGGSSYALLDGHVPWLPAQAEPFVVVGMGALFGGIAKAPMAVMLMVAEMTGEFTMIVPAMIATSISYLVTGNTTIYESQVATRADSPAHRGEYTIPLIQALTVGQAMRDAVVARLDMPLAEAVGLADGDRQQVIAVVDDGRLVGALPVVEHLQGGSDGRTVRDVMQPVGLVAFPVESLHAALQRMIRASVEGLLIVEREHPDRLLGFVSLSELARVLDYQVSELARRPERAQAMSNDPLRLIPVEEAMSRDFRTVDLATLLPDVEELMVRHGDHAVFVLRQDESLYGILTATDLRRARIEDSEAQTAADIATTEPIVAHQGQFLADALTQAGAEAVRQLPVVAERDGRRYPVGLLARNDVLTAYLRSRDQRARNGRQLEQDGGEDREEVASAEAVVERDSQANGQTLAELGLPPGVVVTLIERDGQILIPAGKTLLRTGDRVRLFGNRAALTPALALLDVPEVPGAAIRSKPARR